MKSKKQKLSLEDYIDFLSSDKQHPLTVDSLNQIISIHGFKKQKRLKKELSDAVETIDLMDPSRSTLNSSIFSSNAWLTEKELIGDLDCLVGWKECCVTSIQALNSSSFTDQQQSVPKAQAKKRKRSAAAGFAEGADSFSSALVSFQPS